MWIYQKRSDGSFMVGYYSPGGQFNAISDQATEAAAQALVSYLNGSSTAPG
jgi:hypothetical protein